MYRDVKAIEKSLLKNYASVECVVAHQKTSQKEQKRKKYTKVFSHKLGPFIALGKKEKNIYLYTHTQYKRGINNNSWFPTFCEISQVCIRFFLLQLSFLYMWLETSFVAVSLAASSWPCWPPWGRGTRHRRQKRTQSGA